jgi:hypothetical protein
MPATTAPSAALYTVLYTTGIWSWTLGLIGGGPPQSDSDSLLDPRD